MKVLKEIKETLRFMFNDVLMLVIILSWLWLFNAAWITFEYVTKGGGY